MREYRLTERPLRRTAQLLLSTLPLLWACSKSADTSETAAAQPPSAPVAAEGPPLRSSEKKTPAAPSAPESVRPPAPTRASTETAERDTGPTACSPESLVGTWTHEGEQTTVVFRADGSCESRITDCEDGPCRTDTVRCNWKIRPSGAVEVRYPKGAARRSPISYTLGAVPGGPALFIEGEFALAKQSGGAPKPPLLHVCTVSVDRGGCEETDTAPLRLAAELCFEDGTKQTIRATQCKALYDDARKRAPERILKSTGYTVTVLPGLLRTKEKTIVDHASGLCTELTCRSDFVSRESKLLSFFGPYLTWSERVSDAGAGGPPYHNTTWTTLNLETGASANIVDLFEEASLLEAIRADGWVAKNFSDEQKTHLAKAVSWADVRPLLKPYGFLTDGLERFAVYAYDRKKNRAAVRVAFMPETCGMCVNEISTLGLMLTPSPETAAFLKFAARDRGFFMSTKNIERRFH